MICVTRIFISALIAVNSINVNAYPKPTQPLPPKISILPLANPTPKNPIQPPVQSEPKPKALNPTSSPRPEHPIQPLEPEPEAPIPPASPRPQHPIQPELEATSPLPKDTEVKIGDFLMIIPEKSQSTRSKRQSTGSSMTVVGQGVGSISGAGFTVPGRSVAQIDIVLNFPVLSSQNVKDIESLVESAIHASKREEYYHEKQTHKSASGSLSFFKPFSGIKASASSDEITRNMEYYGISEENQAVIINAIAEMMTATSPMKYSCTVNNNDSPYSRSGNFFAYVMSGTVTIENVQYEYRFLSDDGTFGNSPNDSAPSE
eukprot:Pgem_evm1s3733